MTTTSKVKKSNKQQLEKMDAQFKLAMTYYKGNGVDKNEKEAFKLLLTIAKQGHVEAQYCLGVCYYTGKGTTQDDKKAFEWFKKAADQGMAEAQFCLGDCYYTGKGTTQDHKKAFEWFKKAADQGMAEAQFCLGDCYYTGKGTTQDDKKAFEWFKKAAEQGYAQAQLHLGVFYNTGKGTTQDHKKAFEWCKKAADQDHAKAQFELGLCYATGTGTTQDDKKAFEWCKKAADQDHAKAQFALGLFYATGKGTTQDHKKAFEWYKKAADQGMAEAQFILGNCYDTGKGTTQDDKKAFEWFKKAADQGYADAQFHLGASYNIGKGTTQDDKEAFEWYKKAADQGIAYAQLALGHLYLDGKISNKPDYKSCYFYLSKIKTLDYLPPSMAAYVPNLINENSFDSINDWWTVLLTLIRNKTLKEYFSTITTINHGSKLDHSVSNIKRIIFSKLNGIKNSTGNRHNTLLDISDKVFNILITFILKDNNRLNENLYHYTSLKALNSIISSKDTNPNNNHTEITKIHLSHVTCMSDTQECRTLLNLLSSFDVKNNNTNLNSDIDLTDKLYDMYLISFSKSNRHGDNLSQWRSYGDNGKGVSIGVPINCIPEKELNFSSKLSNIAMDIDNTQLSSKNSQNKSNDQGARILGKVYYLDMNLKRYENKYRDIKELLKKSSFKKDNDSITHTLQTYITEYELIKELKELSSMISKYLKGKQNTDKNKQALHQCLRWILPFFKDPSYADEQEYRYVYFKGIDHIVTTYTDTNCGFSIPKLIAHERFFLDKENVNYEIIFGPQISIPNQQKYKYSIKNKIGENVNIEFRSSNIHFDEK